MQQLYLYNQVEIHLLYGSRESFTITLLDSKMKAVSYAGSTAKLKITKDSGVDTLTVSVSGADNNKYVFVNTFGTGYTKNKSYKAELEVYPAGYTDPVKRLSTVIYVD